LKKLIAAILLFIILFNIGGQLAIHQYLIFASDRLFNEQINKGNYKVDDLFEVKIPVKMPTIQDWTEYASICGQVQFKNNSYNYVKIKMTRDTVYLVCVPNYEKTRLMAQNIINARQVNDIPINKKEHVPFGKANSADVYHSQLTQFKFPVPVATLTKNNDDRTANILKRFIACPGQPPDTRFLS